MARRPPAPEPDFTIDLHGLHSEQALRRLEQELHAARVRHMSYGVVISGRGWGSPTGKAVLTPLVLKWLQGPDGRRLGVRNARLVNKGGAVAIDLA
jgi:DNA-nicking Smr family endonuclease